MAAAQPHIRLRGLMAIPPAAATPDETRAFFAQMRELLAKAADRHYENAKMDILSMGMSGDYPDAIRVGCHHCAHRHRHLRRTRLQQKAIRHSRNRYLHVDSCKVNR